MKYYTVPNGVRGLMPDGKYYLFENDTEYKQAYTEAKEGEL